MGKAANVTALSDFLLELYHDATECKPDELRLRVLRRLTVLNHSEAVLEDWEAVARQDAFCDLTLNRLGTTARFDDLSDYRASLAYNEHWRRFGASHMMATILGERTVGYVSFVGLCADIRSAAFSDAERLL